MSIPPEPRRASHTARRVLRSEYMVPIALGTASALALAFVGIAVLVRAGSTQDLDMALLNLFRAPGDPATIVGPVWLHEAVRDLTALGSATVLTIIVSVTVVGLAFLGSWRAAGLIVVSIVSGTLLSNRLKDVFARERPDFDTVYATLTNSFPSGHAMLSAVTFLTLGALLAQTTTQWRLRILIFTVAVLLTLAVGISRVVLGVHFPSDVLAGWALGAAWALLWTGLALFLRKRGFVRPSRARLPQNGD